MQAPILNFSVKIDHERKQIGTYIENSYTKCTCIWVGKTGKVYDHLMLN